MADYISSHRAVEGGMIIERQAVRALLLTPHGEVLLIRIRLPDAAAPFWIAPGGGIEPGETADTCLRRELAEELGLTDIEIGPVVWRRRHTFNWAGRRISQQEEYRVVHVHRFEPVMSDVEESAVLDGFRWWAVADLAAADERLTPLSLASILDRYLTEGPPTGPLVEEVLID